LPQAAHHNDLKIALPDKGVALSQETTSLDPHELIQAFDASKRQIQSTLNVFVAP
jgi:hypothetical protein